MKYEKNIESIISIIKNGEKRERNFKLGVEIEHIIVQKDTLESVSYYGENGVEGILADLLGHDCYEGKYEGTYLIGLKHDEYEITLEPGGQFEISIKPYEHIDEIKNVYVEFIEKVRPVLEVKNLMMLSIGYHPKSSIQDIPFNPKKRYEYMSKYFEKTGKYAHNMMKGTAALQISIDYENEEDFIRKFRVANFISPILYLISDNSPVFEGQIYHKFGLRSLIWENTDKARSGVVPSALDRNFGYRDYGEYIMQVPPILILKDDAFIPVGDQLVKDVMEEYTFTKEELEHLMTMVFPDVRVKNYIEIRVGDSMPYPYNFAYVTLIKGLFYNEVALEYLYKLSLRLENEHVNLGREAIREKGFSATYGCKPVYDYLRIMFDLAKKGLSSEERDLLAPLERILIDKNNLATITKDLIEGEGISSLKSMNQNQFLEGVEYDKKTV